MLSARHEIIIEDELSHNTVLGIQVSTDLNSIIFKRYVSSRYNRPDYKITILDEPNENDINQQVKFAGPLS